MSSFGMVMGAAVNVASINYVDDVFSAYPYTGNGSTQTINNGIDLAGKGGLVWLKARGGVFNHYLADTVRGRASALASNMTNSAYTSGSGGDITAFNSNGFSLGTSDFTRTNTASESYASWTFRRAPKFLDIVSFTTDASGNATFSHSLGQAPGMIITKSTGAALGWTSWHRGLTSSNYYIQLNAAASQSSLGSPWISSDAQSVTINGAAGAIGNNIACIAYIFSHDTSADGLIQCGSFVTDASGNATVSLGWEPQFYLGRKSSGADNWQILDAIRGLPTAPSTAEAYLMPNSGNAEATDGAQGCIQPTTNGFTAVGFSASQTHIYIAIRRPNKPPTSGTQVYNAIARTGTGTTAKITGVGFPPDCIQTSCRGNNVGRPSFIDRLRGASRVLRLNGLEAELTSDTSNITSFDLDGITVGADSYGAFVNSSGATYISHCFKRAPGVFEQVCYTGTGANSTVAHNLGVAPELMIVKKRNGVSSFYWGVYAAPLGATKYLSLHNTDAQATNTGFWNSTAPTASVFSVGTYADVNQSGGTFINYLFASKSGISKIGSYTGNGSSQTVDCGFSTGARFVLIKRTDSTGDWFVWDTVRGIVASNDPHLSLNTVSAEVTTDDSIDPDNSGFIVNQAAATNINVNTATYIYLAFS